MLLPEGGGSDRTLDSFGLATLSRNYLVRHLFCSLSAPPIRRAEAPGSPGYFDKDHRVETRPASPHSEITAKVAQESINCQMVTGPETLVEQRNSAASHLFRLLATAHS